MDELVDKINDGKYSIPSKIQLSIESIGFINCLLLNDFEKRMTWKEIGEHPFISKSVKEFNKIDITKVDKKYKNKNELMLDSNNIIWTQLQVNDKNSNFKLAFINGSEYVENQNKNINMKKKENNEQPKEQLKEPFKKISNDEIFNYTNQDFFNQVTYNQGTKPNQVNKDKEIYSYERLNVEMDGIYLLN